MATPSSPLYLNPPQRSAQTFPVPPSPPGSRPVGIGCNVSLKENGEVCIRKVIPGSPAAFSGKLVTRPHTSTLNISHDTLHLDSVQMLLTARQAVDDVILKIDGASVTGNSPDEVARKIAGAEGTSVRISYRIRKYFQVRAAAPAQNTTS